MFTRSLVSVIIPTYNRPLLLKRCLESVLKQTYENIEIIVVDDNNPCSDSRIKTEETMLSYINNPKVQYIQHTRNLNGSAARNTGWRVSRGEYITFIDDDDEISETKIEKQVNCLENLDESWGMCYTGYQIIKGHSANQLSSKLCSGGCYIQALMRTVYLGSGSNLLLRKSVVDKINGYDESFQRNQDIEFLARACEYFKLAAIEDILLTIHKEGARKEMTFEEIDSYAQHYLDIFAFKIDELSTKEKERVVSVISLERFKISIIKKHLATGIRILINNNVKLIYIIKYVIYCIKRQITHKSYGFYDL